MAVGEEARGALEEVEADVVGAQQAPQQLVAVGQTSEDLRRREGLVRVRVRVRT